jgi:AraC family transcriptional regulator of adaptative response / methylphosphotriester-DNA alkyltransferase methyltransferase
MQAVAENFRPCKRCKPDGGRLPNEEWVAQMAQVIETRFSEELTLGKLADMFHGSPYHLQRTFKRIHGISPSEFLLRTRMKNAQSLLANSDHSIMDIASAVGIANTSHFSTQFLRQTGNTPTQYRNAARKTDQREATPRLNDK